MLCVFYVFVPIVGFVAVFISLLFILFVTVHRIINFLVNLHWEWDSKYPDSDFDTACTCIKSAFDATLCCSIPFSKPFHCLDACLGGQG